jgi:hypothetical protein
VLISIVVSVYNEQDALVELSEGVSRDGDGQNDPADIPRTLEQRNRFRADS